MVKEFMKRNSILLLGIIILLVLFLIGDNRLETTNISYPNSEIIFSTEDEVLEQTWAPNMKNIVDIKVPYQSDDSFEGVIELVIYTDDYQNIIVSEKINHSFQEGQAGELVFSLGRTPIEVGNRYRFRLCFLEESESGAIRLASHNNYAGGMIGKRILNEGIKLNFVFEKISRIEWILVTYMPFLFIALFYAVYWNKKMEETIGLSFITTILFLWFLGLLGILEAGIRLVYILSVICFLIAIVLVRKRKINVYSLITPGIVIWGGMMCFIIFSCRNMYFIHWDEYSHWGLAAKDMFYYDELSNHLGSSVLLKRYPPFSTLIEYFFSYTYEVFSEEIVYVAYLSLICSLLAYFFRNITWRTWKSAVVSIIVIALLPGFFFGSIVYGILVDFLMAILTAYVLMCYYCEKMSVYNILCIGGAMMGLVLTKEIGLVLAGLLFLLILVDTFWKRIANKSKLFINWKENLPIILFAILIGGAFWIWQSYISIPVISESGEAADKIKGAVSASGISLKGILDIITFKASEYKYEAIKAFFRVSVLTGVYKIWRIGFSYWGIGAIILILSCVFYKKEDSPGKKHNFLSFGILNCCVLLGYALFLLTTYLFSFTSVEALQVTSHERYLGTCICGVFLAFIGLVIQNSLEDGVCQSGKKIMNRVTAIICLLLVIGVPINSIFPAQEKSYITEGTMEEFRQIEEVVRCFADKDESVYYVCSNTSGLSYFIFSVFMSPMEATGYRGWDIYSSEDMLNKEIQYYQEKGMELSPHGRKIKSAETLKEELKDYDYLFLHYPSTVFAESYGELFDNIDTIGTKTFFKVNNTGSDIVLEYVGQVG